MKCPFLHKKKLPYCIEFEDEEYTERRWEADYFEAICYHENQGRCTYIKKKSIMLIVIIVGLLLIIKKQINRETCFYDCTSLEQFWKLT